MASISSSIPRYDYTVKIGKPTSPGPECYRFRNFYVDTDNGIVYHKERFGAFKFSFDYDIRSRCLTSNRLDSYVPVEIGQLWPVGLHISNIIALDMLMKDNLVFLHGASFEIDGKTVCVFSPSGTGKSTMIRKKIANGARYISEDVILTDGTKV